MHISPLISDLAIMLLTAGLINILFKKIKLPVILGYILAGFLISPYFPLFLHVQETDSISTWSDIGVIILLFCIGLEFDLHKLVRLGSSAVITAAVKLSGVIAVGFVLGIAMTSRLRSCRLLLMTPGFAAASAASRPLSTTLYSIFC